MVRWAGSLLAVGAVVTLLGWFIMHKPAVESAEPPAPPRPRDEFAADRAPAVPPVIPFDAKRAMGYLEAVCKIGPRISGTEGMQKQQALLKDHFEKHGARVELQRFTARQESRREPVAMANLIASWHPERQRRVILCSHYDTRPIADQEPDPRRWREPFVSANDGGSGVACLMEMAHQMKDVKTAVGVDFVFFDGEEYIWDNRRDKYFFGSQHFGREYRTGRPGHRYLGAVLLDMIAGPNPRFPREPKSLVRAGALVEELWAIAAEQQCDAFRSHLGEEVLDDHIALNDAGIPAVDIIDFGYKHWHLLSDVPENCSPEGLSQVAQVLAVWLQRVK
jgi:glutaminyl-peptide cyclotransferase